MMAATEIDGFPHYGDIPHVGISLLGLQRFVQQLVLHAPDGTTRGMTTDAVNKLTMSKITNSNRGAYSDMLGDDPELVGPPSVFVSHAWAMQFDCLLDIVHEADRAIRIESPSSTPYFWLDLLVNDQFSSPSRPFEWWQTVFKSNIERIGHTIVALEWENPLPLNRIWCLWEIFCSCSVVSSELKLSEYNPRSRLDLILPRSSRESFRTALVKDFQSLARKLCCIDLHNADAFHGGVGPGSCSHLPTGCPAVLAGKACPNDRASILRVIESAPGGVDDVSKRIIGCLRNWMVDVAKLELEITAEGDIRASSDLQYYLSRLLRDCGRHSEAEDLMRQSMAARRRCYGDDAIETLYAIGLLGQILRTQGKLGESESLLQEVLTRSQKVLGSDHPLTFDSANHLGNMLQELGKLSNAEQLMQTALVGQRSTLGEDHVETLTTINNLGSLCRAQGKIDGAISYYRQALEIRRRTLGESHPATLLSMSSLGRVLQDYGDLTASELLKRDALSGRRRVLGDSHEDTLISVRDMADLLACRRDDVSAIEEAMKLISEAHRGLQLLLGDMHAFTLSTFRTKGRLLAARGEYKEAAQALQHAHDGQIAIGNLVEAKRTMKCIEELAFSTI